MQVGQKVAGIYSGQFPYSGTIRESRPVTVQTDGAMLFFVDLDAPIEVYGMVRESLAVHTKFDGSPTSYVKYADTMAPQ